MRHPHHSLMTRLAVDDRADEQARRERALERDLEARRNRDRLDDGAIAQHYPSTASEVAP